jgi:hypothetical protein
MERERERRRRREEAQLGSGIGQASGGKMEGLGTRGTLATRIGYPVLLPHNLSKHRDLHTRIQTHSSLLLAPRSLPLGVPHDSHVYVYWEGYGNRNELIRSRDCTGLLGRKWQQKCTWNGLIRRENCMSLGKEIAAECTHWEWGLHMSLGKETQGNGDKMSGTHQEQELRMLDKERRPPSSHAQSCH